jgi:hypothetical protein
VRFLIAGMSPEMFKNYKHTKKKVVSRKKREITLRSLKVG